MPRKTVIGSERNISSGAFSLGRDKDFGSGAQKHAESVLVPTTKNSSTNEMQITTATGWRKRKLDATLIGRDIPWTTFVPLLATLATPGTK